MIQKIHLRSDGVVEPVKSEFYIRHTKDQPATRLTRIQELLKTHAPRLCIVRGPGLGDVIMTTPVVHAIKQLFGSVHLGYATNTNYFNGALVDVLKYNPDIDEILDMEQINDINYDAIINLHCPCMPYEKRENPPINRIDLFARHTGIQLTDHQPRYYIQQEEVMEGSYKIAPFRDKPIILHQPFASSSRRMLDPRVYKQVLIQLANYGINNLVLTHQGDPPSEIMWDAIPRTRTMHNLGVREIASIMIHCNAVLCPDSSMLHLAGALQVPTVGLFGPTHPDARINYYPDTIAVWKGISLKCAPCWYGDCPMGIACWKMMSAEDIVTACLDRLENKNKLDINKLLQNRRATIKSEII